MFPSLTSCKYCIIPRLTYFTQNVICGHFLTLRAGMLYWYRGREHWDKPVSRALNKIRINFEVTDMKMLASCL